MSDTHNLLLEPILSVRVADRVSRVTLPGLLATLGQGAEAVSFPRLQPVQTHAWHAFLVQLAVLAMARAGVDLDADEASWREALLGLAGGEASVWCLYEPDLRRPAFMQPPCFDGTLDAYKPPAGIGVLDLPVTTRNHEVKGARVVAPEPEHWAIALASFQTMQGFSGRDNYGVMRMNGGSGNRPGVGLTPSLDPGVRFRRDVAVVRQARPACESLGFDLAGIALLWLLPWDGTTSLSLSELDPQALEICRRLRWTPAGLQMATSKRARVEAATKGVVGDPWTPIHRTEAKSMTLSGQGFDYQRVRALLLGNTWQAGAAQRFAPDESGRTMLLNLWALVRGNGKTEGMHTRTVALSKTATFWMKNKEGELGDRAEVWAKNAGTVRNKLLGDALAKLCGGREQVPPGPKQAFDARVDEAYFPRLFESLEGNDRDAAEAEWVRWLIAEADTLLEAAIDVTPLPAARRYRRIDASKRAFYGARKRHFGALLDANQESENP